MLHEHSKFFNFKCVCYHDFMFLEDILFPKFCLGCGLIGAYICLRCEKKLQYREHDICPYCYKRSMYGFTHPNCRRRLGLDGAQSVFQYNPLFRKLIKNFKYRSASKIFEELKQVILPSMLQKIYIPPNAYLNPIPLHPLRQKERGFNQAHLVAEYFATYFHLPLTQVLTRVKETKAQAQLTKPEDRVANMRNAFEILENSYVPQTVIVVDDVLTSGSTLKEAAHVLKSHGVRHVFALTLAHG